MTTTKNEVWKKVTINLLYGMCNDAYILYNKTGSKMPNIDRLKFVQVVVEELYIEKLAERTTLDRLANKLSCCNNAAHRRSTLIQVGN